MLKHRRIRWGGYRSWEGPYYPGTQGVEELYPNPTPDLSLKEKILLVFTATEGGRFDAINMYDRCIISVGLIQYCEAGQFSVSNMLGYVAEHGTLGPEFSAWMEEIGYAFTNKIRGKWRFYHGSNIEEVDTINEQRGLFLAGTSGKKGGWGPSGSPEREYAKNWASAMASVFEHKEAQKAQASYILPRVESFALSDAKRVWSVRPVGDPWAEAGYAAFLSYAGNLPTTANRMLKQHVKQTTEAPFTEGWTIEMLKQLTFGPNISIYPHRYNSIRPVVEKLYEIDLPDFADLLRKVKSTAWDIRGIQEKLKELGFPLGPAGVDGKWGPKSTQALFDFETVAGIKKPDGIPDKESIGLLMKSKHIKIEEALEIHDEPEEADGN